MLTPSIIMLIWIIVNLNYSPDKQEENQKSDPSTKWHKYIPVVELLVKCKIYPCGKNIIIFGKSICLGTYQPFK